MLWAVLVVLVLILLVLMMTSLVLVRLALVVLLLLLLLQAFLWYCIVGIMQLIQQIPPLPRHGLQPFGSHAVIRQQTTLVAPHAQMVHEQRACCRRVFGRVERALAGSCFGVDGRKGLENPRHVAVEVADFPYDRAHEFGLVRWEGGEGLGAFCMLDLETPGRKWLVQ